MGILSYYKYINNYTITEDTYKPYIPPPRKEIKYVVPQAIPITTSDLDVRSRDFITAHDLRDYRRTSFNLVLLPIVTTPYDIIAKEVYGLDECM